MSTATHRRLIAHRHKLPPSLRFRVLHRDGYACQYCGRHAPDVSLEIDHRVPVALGETEHPSNLITACQDCNRGKADSTEADDGSLQRPTRSRRCLPRYGDLPETVRLEALLPDGRLGWHEINWLDMRADQWRQFASSLLAKSRKLRLQAEWCHQFSGLLEESDATLRDRVGRPQDPDE